MKQITHLLYLFFLVFALSFVACDPCADTTCQNGGICEKGSCECPIQYWGPFCETEKAPTAVLLESVIVGGFTNTDPSGLPWDIGSGPDVYLEFYQNNSLLGISNLIEDEDPGRTRSFSGGDLPIELNPDELLQVRVMDFDDATDRELIFFSYVSPYTSGAGFPINILGTGLSINVSYQHN